MRRQIEAQKLVTGTNAHRSSRQPAAAVHQEVGRGIAVTASAGGVDRKDLKLLLISARQIRPDCTHNALNARLSIVPDNRRNIDKDARPLSNDALSESVTMSPEPRVARADVGCSRDPLHA